jgi:hypothetical protein
MPYCWQSGEVCGHLVTIEDWLESARGAPQPATEPQRAVHTSTAPSRSKCR